MNNNDTSAIEQNETIVRLLRINWKDSQATSEWDRISFQLHGASLVADGQLKDELDFLSTLAFHRGAMLKPDYEQMRELERRLNYYRETQNERISQVMANR